MTQSNQENKNIHTYLEAVWPGYRTEAPLPPELLLLTMGYLIEEYKEWHENGRLRVQSTYVNGEEHGEYKEWWDNGKLAVQTTYVNGEKHGEFKEWHPDGRLWLRKTYRNGICIGQYFNVD